MNHDRALEFAQDYANQVRHEANRDGIKRLAVEAADVDNALSEIRQELRDLRQIGDQMQSAFDRVRSALVKASNEMPGLGYEANMALIEGSDAIEEWTEARKKSR